MSAVSCDVLVVGLGPAGGAAAAAAAKLGLRVVGVEKKRVVGVPVQCAEFIPLPLGRHAVQWLDMPHVPHGWECGLLMDSTTRTFFCGDLLTQPGDGAAALVTDDILGPSEAFRQAMDYYAHAPHTGEALRRLAAQEPRTLACMHGSAWQGDGAELLRRLAEAVMR